MKRLNDVGEPVIPFDYGRKNVTLDFKIGIGKLAGEISLQDTLYTKGGVFYYEYESLSR